MTSDPTTTFTVSGMSCAHCEAAIAKEVGAVPGVTAAVADREAGAVTVTGAADPDAVRAAIVEAGYEPTS